MNDKDLIQSKIHQATDILNELSIDTWLTFIRETPLTPDPVQDLILGMHLTWQSALLINRSGRHVAIVGQYDAVNVEALEAYQVIGYQKGIAEHLREQFEVHRPQQIALNYSLTDVAADGLSHGMFLRLQEILAGTRFVAERFISAERVVAALRGRKTAEEVLRIRAAVKTTEALFNEVEAFVRPGMTQRQIADFVHERIDNRGLGYAWDREYNPVVTCGPESPIGHAAPGEVVLKKGHTLHLDLGVKQNGYCSDIQRMWYVLDEGETEAPAEVQRAFDIVRGAIIAGEQVLRPGVPGWQVDEIARDYVTDNGYPEYMHALGHLLGRSAHDGAAVLGPRWEKYAGICEIPVEADNVFTLELHVQVPERGIMSLEEDVLVMEDGVAYLSRPQTQLRYIRS